MRRNVLRPHQVVLRMKWLAGWKDDFYLSTPLHERKKEIELCICRFCCHCRNAGIILVHSEPMKKRICSGLEGCGFFVVLKNKVFGFFLF